jgi:hypothetical protein
MKWKMGKWKQAKTGENTYSDEVQQLEMWKNVTIKKLPNTGRGVLKTQIELS